MNSMKAPTTPVDAPVQHSDLWVMEGVLDLPAFLPKQELTGNHAARGLLLDFSGRTGDGLIELRASDAARVKEPVWWSTDDPVRFEFRASVRAPTLFDAWPRSADFLEQMLDRLTFLSGAPTRSLQRGMLYNETQIEECRNGRLSEFECTTHGTAVRKTAPFTNLHTTSQFLPSDRTKRALRWFRKGLTNQNVEDRFLAFYFSLECISNDIKETIEKTHTCKKCGESTGIQRSQTDGIKALIARHPETPNSLFAQLGRTRAKLVHGNDPNAHDAVKQLEPTIRSLAAEGIALSLRVDPASIRVVDTSCPEIIPLMRGSYDPSTDPAGKWGRSITTLLATLAAR